MDGSDGPQPAHGLRGAGLEAVKTPFRAPDANAHAERWVGSVTRECLDHLILFGLGSLQRALRTYVSFFSEHCPHQGIANRTPAGERDAVVPFDHTAGRPEQHLRVECQPILGGLLASYFRRAA